jgi:hypothetical protein
VEIGGKWERTMVVFGRRMVIVTKEGGIGREKDAILGRMCGGRVWC